VFHYVHNFDDPTPSGKLVGGVTQFKIIDHRPIIIFIIVPGIRTVNILKTPSRKNHEASGQKMTKVAGHG
jgi:hypothetical protein